jgi:large subunit ribosomal protein L35
MANKLKTHSGAKKRFKKRKNGYKHANSNARHILTKKPQKAKRQRRALDSIEGSDIASVRQMLPHS